MTVKGPCWNVYSQAVSHFLGKHSNQFLMDMYSWGAVSGKKKASLRKHWSVQWAPISALPQCHPGKIYWFKCTFTFLWCVRAVCLRWQAGLEPRPPGADLSLTPLLSLGQGQGTSFPIHSIFLHLQNRTTESFCSGFWKGVWGRKDEWASSLLLLQLLHFSLKHQI